ncbi:unnamed protein product [Chrysoparadoxa australica]
MGNEMTSERVNLGGTSGLLLRPPPGPPISTGVLLLAGPCGIDAPGLRALAVELASRGHLTLLPDIYRGAPWNDKEGEGEAGSRWLRLSKWCAAQNTQSMALDIQAGVKFLRANHAVRVGGVGFSIGSSALLQALDWFDAAACFYPFGLVASEVEASPVPLLLVLAGDDEVVSQQEAEALRSGQGMKSPCVRVISIDGAPHLFATAQGGLNGSAAAIQETKMELLSWVAEKFHLNSGDWEMPRIRANAPQEDEWWVEEQGKGCSFCNVGLSNWELSRSRWKVPRQRRPAPPPPVAYDVVLEGLAATRRTFELPGRMSLPDIVTIFTDIWEVQAEC